MKKLISILIAFAMMATLAVTSAFAVNQLDGDETTSANPLIEKNLNIAAGVTHPELNFKFDITQLTSTTQFAPYGAALDASEFSTVARALSTKEVTFTETTTAAGDQTNSVALFGANETYTSAGKYAYEVKERANTYTSIYTGDDAKYEDAVVYSDAEYFVTVYVANGDHGLYVKHVTVQKITTNKETGAKTLGEKEPLLPAGSTTGNNGFEFENTYTKKTKNINPKTDLAKTLYVEKTVDGDAGDKNQKFDFSVTVAAPAEDANAEFEAVILDKDTGKYYAASDTDTATAAEVAGAKKYTFASGTEIFKLAHNEQLVFTKIPYGATYTVEETDTDATYTKTVKYTDYAAQTNPVDFTNGKKVENKIMTNNESIGNYAIVKNYRATETPEGILISNLPYIALALVAIGGLVAYVVIRRRNADEA